MMIPLRDPAASGVFPGTYRFKEHGLTISRGHPLPMGASRASDGYNFVLISRHATAVVLVLFDENGAEPLVEIPLELDRNRTGNHWHIRVSGLPDQFCYGYRVDGPQGGGHRYDPSQILIDPAAQALSSGKPWGRPHPHPRYSLALPPRNERLISVMPRIPREDTVLYELHIRGFTAHESSGVQHPGTYRGLIEKIQHLKDLGVTAVELLPVDEFDENDCPFVDPFTGKRLKNFWGYNTIAYSAPKAAYSSDPKGAGPLNEFREMVGEFHRSGLEVILDVVFNHTAEGGENGPTYNFRGLDNTLYYMLDKQGRYLNFTGCGNTVNSNHPMVRSMVLSCLRSWVAEMSVDGFRFDLASVFGRDRQGQVLVEPPVVEIITEDALLADAKLIAEPWDASGLYQLGCFPGGSRWSEWNGRFRDDVRRFWRGDPGMTRLLATRLCGSDDLYQGRSPRHSVNFITCHDGFTLMDTVSYNEKHNHANGESNRDGYDYNWSWNCGFEGPTDKPEVLAIRRRQARNLMTTLLVSQGVPMLLAGDEFLRTQQGNNNAWCQDNEISWVDWSLAEKNQDFLRFVKMMIALRMRHPVLRRRTFFNSEPGAANDIVWHGVKPCQPDWGDNSRALAFALDGRRCDRPGVIDRDIYIAFNSYWEPLTFVIPASPSGRRWRRVVNTALPSPHDIVEFKNGPPIEVSHPYRLESRSMIILVSEET